MPVACTEAIAVEQLDATLAAAESALERIDAVAFEDAHHLAGQQLVCVGAFLPVAIAARYHRVEGLYLDTIAGDTAAGLASLLAARVVAPTYVFPVALLPVGEGTLRQQYESWPATERGRVEIELPRGWRFAFDGREGPRPAERPTIWQAINGEGHVQTAYLAAADVIPSVPEVGGERRGSPVGFVGVAGGLALVGVAVVAQLDIASTYHRNAGDHLDSDMRDWYVANHVGTKQLVNVGVGVVGVGLATGGLGFAIGGRW